MLHRVPLLLHCLCCCTSVEVVVWLASWSLHGEIYVKEYVHGYISLRFFLTENFGPKVITDLHVNTTLDVSFSLL